ncbi:tail protein X [Celerinatantimonas sp. YJH-8]|uniref:tail protein X n=1 Tax=Celerinatantimonas sp. YJH-8 TaxID=3228714 RepID=UPI0038BF3F73
MTTIRSQQGDTVDALCWRYYGRTSAVTEAVLQANPGLADYGPTLPAGLTLTLPERVVQPSTAQVQLWE